MNAVRGTLVALLGMGLWAAPPTDPAGAFEIVSFNGQFTRSVAGTQTASDSMADALLSLTSSAQLSNVLDNRRIG